MPCKRKGEVEPIRICDCCGGFMDNDGFLAYCDACVDACCDDDEEDSDEEEDDGQCLQSFVSGVWYK